MAAENPTKVPGRVRDITGRRYGRLLVTGFVSIKGDETYWACICDCGTKRVVLRKSLTSGVTQSCGCLRLERTVKHGMHLSPEYGTWHAMISRCRYAKGAKYLRYQGRGITVCERWKSFDNFYADMGPKPSPLHSIDRIDNDQGYSLENCRWVTSKQQSRNIRTNRIVEFRGERRALAEWSELLSMPRYVLANRLNRGWSVERAMTAPIKPYRLSR